jgi:tetratricopeptide (TPR) repeat protein
VDHRQLKEANAQYETLKRLEPKANPFDRALINWAGAYIVQDTISQIRHLKVALDYSPGNNVLSYVLAATKKDVNDYRGAVDALLPTVKMKWQYSTAYYLLADCYDELKEFAKAKEVLEQSLSLRWVYYNIYNLLSVYALRDKDTTKAREYESAYLQGGKVYGLPKNQMYATLGSNNLSEGFYNSAIRYYQVAASLEPKSAAYRDELGEAFFLVGNREAAGNEFLQAVRLDPTKARAHLRLGELSDTNKDTTASIRHYAAYLKLDSVSSRAAEVRQRLFSLEIRSKNVLNRQDARQAN